MKIISNRFVVRLRRAYSLDRVSRFQVEVS